MFCCQDALVAELVDAHASGACGRSPVEVQVLFRAPINISSSVFEGLLFINICRIIFYKIPNTEYFLKYKLLL